jgi:RNA polymerase subunit RPABC4/transcription elongation factor Spt4
MTFALFGISNDGLNLAVNLLVFFLVVIWVALVYWTYSDASRRLDDPLLIGCATVASLFPFIGTIVYTIVRPPEYLEDAHERELEIRAAEKRLALLDNRTCRNCGSEIEPNFLRCPTCMRKLKEPCRSCGRPLDPRWRVCPYCEAEVTTSMRDERGERRRRTRRDGERQPRVARTVDRASSTPARTEDAMPEPTASVSGERRASQSPPDR